MTTVKQLIEFLSKIPEDVVVRVLKENNSGYSTTTVYENIDLPNDLNVSKNVCLWGGGGDNPPKYLDLGEN
jgi:hypothetical protein